MEELLEDARKEISGVIQPLKRDLAAISKKMNDFEASQKLLAEKYDTLLISIQEQKKHNKDSRNQIDVINRSWGKGDDVFNACKKLKSQQTRDLLSVFFC